MKEKFHVTIDLRNPENHRAQIQIRALKSFSLPEQILFPVWTPGSYFVRDYSRHVTRLSGAEKIEKNIWRLIGERKSISYEVYGMERTVRTSFIDDRYIALVGASLLPLLHSSFTVELLLPPAWSFVSSALKFCKKSPGHWIANARDDDHWIDSPIISAAPGFGAQSSFTAQGIRHHIAWVGTECARNSKELERDFKKIAEATLKMFGGSPFKEYWFLLHFGSKLYGGLEHRDSQLSQFDGSSISEEKDYDAFLRLIAHEYFHSWNVKSIRPQALGPFHYEKENYTEELWFAEGLTDYFDDMIPLHAGLITQEAYEKARLKSIQGMNDGLPAQQRRALSESSFDAWIRYYRGDEDSDNTDVSYYTKGALLGWCWDAELQKKTHGRWTLAKLLAAIWKEFGIDAYEPLAQAKPGYTREEIFEFAEKCTKLSHHFVEKWITTRKALPWRDAADYFKISYEEKIADPILHYTGAQIQWKGTQAIVSKVISGSIAESQGIAAGDELLAINTWRVLDSERFQLHWKKILEKKTKVQFTFCRMERIYQCKLMPTPHKGLGMNADWKSHGKN